MINDNLKSKIKQIKDKFDFYEGEIKKANKIIRKLENDLDRCHMVIKDGINMCKGFEYNRRLN